MWWMNPSLKTAEKKKLVGLPGSVWMMEGATAVDATPASGSQVPRRPLRQGGHSRIRQGWYHNPSKKAVWARESALEVG